MSANLGAHLKRWSELLGSSSDTARLDAEILLKHITGLDDAQLIMRDQEELNEQTVSQVNQLIESRMMGVPIAYLVGQREFYALSLEINQHVLIPRPETELLVETALELLSVQSAPRILDLGTGSGAIALAIACNNRRAQLVATDSNKHAIGLASKNARALKIYNVRFIHSNWYQALTGERFDLIVSNPPYIDPDDPHLAQGDVRFEPRSALVAADRGLADIRHIIDQSHTHLEAGGWLALEHGYDQGPAVRSLLGSRGFEKVRTLKDLNRHERVSTGTWAI